MNIGLGLMVAVSLLPVGIAPTWASIEHGLWFARSAEFLQQPWIETLRWMRMFGDTIFMIGVACLAWFAAGLLTGWSYQRQKTAERTPAAAPAAPSLPAPSSTSAALHS